MVAKTYQGWTTYGEPFEENKKMYVVVVTPKGAHKKVRWYNETEYAKMYPDAEPSYKKLRSLKEVLGFKEGYITIFKGDTYPLLDWFHEQPACRYHNYWGWYVVSTEAVPALPAGIEAIQLRWEDVSYEGEDALKSESAVKDHLAALLYDPSPSEYQGEVGDRIERAVTVTKALPIDGYYGTSTMHIFVDDEENVYVWTTAAKTLEAGESYLLKGTIKELKTYKGIKQTVLTRCKVS